MYKYTLYAIRFYHHHSSLLALSVPTPNYHYMGVMITVGYIYRRGVYHYTTIIKTAPFTALAYIATHAPQIGGKYDLIIV